MFGKHDEPTRTESDTARLQRLRDAIEPAWRQAERGEFADHSLAKTLRKLGLDR
jgi:antitoxin ParD1/3/4